MKVKPGTKYHLVNKAGEYLARNDETTMETAEARVFTGDYLGNTCWSWQHQWEAVEA